MSRLVQGATKPSVQQVPGVKSMEHGSDDSPPSSVEVKDIWKYNSTPPIHTGMVPNEEQETFRGVVLS
jgi:hypothetical protein